MAVQRWLWVVWEAGTPPIPVSPIDPVPPPAPPWSPVWDKGVWVVVAFGVGSPPIVWFPEPVGMAVGIVPPV